MSIPPTPSLLELQMLIGRALTLSDAHQLHDVGIALDQARHRLRSLLKDRDVAGACNRAGDDVP